MSASGWLLLIKPGCVVTQRHVHAPVSVAKSTIASGFVLGGVGKRIRQDDATLGVGVDDLHRLAVVGAVTSPGL